MSERTTRRRGGDVFVRTPRRGGLARVLAEQGATVVLESGHGLSVAGMASWRIAAIAAQHHIPIQELTPRSGDDRVLRHRPPTAAMACAASARLVR